MAVLFFDETWFKCNESNKDSPSSSHGSEGAAEPIKMDSQGTILSVAFLSDGKHVMSGSREGKIQCWRVEDGGKVETNMEAGGVVCNIAISQDGKWAVNGTEEGTAKVWNVETHEMTRAINGGVYAVDISSDGARVATGNSTASVWSRFTGSGDYTVSVWSRSTGKRLLGPLQHQNIVYAVKFSPDGRHLATATQHAVQVYDSRDGQPSVDIPITVGPQVNHSLVWTSDSKELIVLSLDGNINCVDVFTGVTRSRWPIHSSENSMCISLAKNRKFIAVSADSLVSFWDTTTQKQIGRAIQHIASIMSLAISANYDLVVGGGKTITLRSLRDILPSSYIGDINEVEKAIVDDTIGFLCTRETSDLRITRLEETVRQLRDSQSAAAEERVNLNETINSLRAQNENANTRIQQLNDQLFAFKREVNGLKKTIELSATEVTNLKQQLRDQYCCSQRRADSLAQILHAHEQQYQCRILYADGRIINAALSLLEITDAVNEVRANKVIMDWLAEFKSQCICTLETIGDEALGAKKEKEAIDAYSTALSHCPLTPNTLLIKWTSTMLIRSPPDEVLTAASQFEHPSFLIYQAICDALEQNSCISEAIEYFQQMQNELGEDTIHHDEWAQWELDFQQRCAERLRDLGDAAVVSQNYNEAIQHFSTILSLDLPDRIEILVKRSEARALMGYWEEALSDADEVIKLNHSSHQGYLRRHAALHGAGRYAEAVKAFRTMLSILNHSSDPHIHELRRNYKDAEPAIRRIVAETIRHMPRILIDTATDRLYDKQQQAAAFKSLPIYNELVSSMTTEIDLAHIRKVVKRFYRYVMLSHRWEDQGEPLLQDVDSISIRGLEASPANIKLQRFCSLVHSLDIQWAWSDTCCVDKSNNVVLQESLVAMFTWYRGSSLTIVYLRDVSSESQLPGDLQQSVWNTRAWTYQEYVASEIIQFYTQDWKPYLDLTLPNHKKSPVIISEMQQATGISAEEMVALRPGLDRVREKLYLASKRQTTLVEDIAYSLLGIFNISIPVIYGERDHAVGRLLEYILMGSRDVAILAWTGPVGTYHSCLPLDLTVYDKLVPPHIPQPIGKDEMDTTVAALHSSFTDTTPAVALYNQLHRLGSPSMKAQRLRLPGIVLCLGKPVHTSGPDPVTNINVYHAISSVVKLVEIKTTGSLTETKDLYLVHPWIRSLLDQEFSVGAAALDQATQAFRLFTRLRQPFGALLLEQLSRVEYKRVAADSLVMVQVREEVSLTELMENIRTIEVQ